MFAETTALLAGKSWEFGTIAEAGCSGMGRTERHEPHLAILGDDIRGGASTRTSTYKLILYGQREVHSDLWT